MYTMYEPTKITYTSIHHETMYCITCRKRPVRRDPTPSVQVKRRKILVDVDMYKFEKLLKFTHDMYYRRLSLSENSDQRQSLNSYATVHKTLLHLLKD